MCLCTSVYSVFDFSFPLPPPPPFGWQSPFGVRWACSQRCSSGGLDSSQGVHEGAALPRGTNPHGARDQAEGDREAIGEFGVPLSYCVIRAVLYLI